MKKDFALQSSQKPIAYVERAFGNAATSRDPEADRIERHRSDEFEVPGGTRKPAHVLGEIRHLLYGNDIRRVAEVPQRPPDFEHLETARQLRPEIREIQEIGVALLGEIARQAMKRGRVGG